MKIYIDTPWLKLYVEHQPMEKYKFYAMWGAIVACVMTLAFFSIFK